MNASATLRTILILTLGFALLWVFWGCSTDEATVNGPIAPSGTQISDTLRGILTAASSPYWVTKDIIVPAGENLIIQPGVELRFGGLYRFLIQGHLEAVGTADENIVFTSMDGALGAGDLGQWRSIIFDTGQDTSLLEYCTVQFGAVWDSTTRYPVRPTTDPDSILNYWLNSAIFCANSNPIIRNCTIVRNGYHGIYSLGYGSNPTSINNILVENDGDGIRCEFGGSANVWHTNSWKNHARNYAETPDGIGEMMQLNTNRDSCDFQYNISLDPLFENLAIQDYDLHPCSPCINTGLGGLNIGSIPYVVASNELRGPTGDRVLTAAGSPWLVTCHLYVGAGKSLVIEPGARLVFRDIYELRVDGLLQADGATFIPEDSTNSNTHWMGILLTNQANPASYIRNCRLINASTSLQDADDPYGGAITVQGIDPDLSYNTFTNSLYAAISCQHSAEPTISYNVITGCGIAAIYCFENSHPNIHHNLISDVAGYGIWCQDFASPTINSNLIYETSFIGIKCQEQAAPLIQYNTISQNDYSGIVCSQNSNPVIRNNVIAFNGSPQKWSASSYGNGIQCTVSSVPTITYNDVYQPPGQGLVLWGITMDNTNLSVDPQFSNADAGDYHLQSGSPCLTASSSGGEIGAYGLGDW